MVKVTPKGLADDGASNESIGSMKPSAAATDVPLSKPPRLTKKQSINLPDLAPKKNHRKMTTVEGSSFTSGPVSVDKFIPVQQQISAPRKKYIRKTFINNKDEKSE